MKDMVETAVLTNGAGCLKATSNGLASPASPGACSDASSSDLHLHLPADSEDEEVPARDTCRSPDLESIHEPKTSKPSATVVNLMNMYTDSANNSYSLENAKSPNKEDNECISKSVASLKSDSSTQEKVEVLGSNKCVVQSANDSENDSEVGATMNPVTADISVDESLKQNDVENSSGGTKEETTIARAVASDVSQTSEDESSHAIVDTVVLKEKKCNSESSLIEAVSNGREKEEHANLAKVNFLGNNCSVKESTASRLLESESVSLNASVNNVESEELVGQNVKKDKTDEEICKDDELVKINKVVPDSFAGNVDSNCLENCDKTEIHDKYRNEFGFKVESKPVLEKEESELNTHSNVSKDKNSTAGSLLEERQCSNVLSNNSDTYLENEDDFELKLELDCSDDSTIDECVLKPGDSDQKTDIKNPILASAEEDSVVAVENEANVVGEVIQVTEDEEAVTSTSLSIGKSMLSKTTELGDVVHVTEDEEADTAASVSIGKSMPRKTTELVGVMHVTEDEEADTTASLSIGKSVPSKTTELVGMHVTEDEGADTTASLSVGRNKPSIKTELDDVICGTEDAETGDQNESLAPEKNKPSTPTELGDVPLVMEDEEMDTTASLALGKNKPNITIGIVVTNTEETEACAVDKSHNSDLKEAVPRVDTGETEVLQSTDNCDKPPSSTVLGGDNQVDIPKTKTVGLHVKSIHELGIKDVLSDRPNADTVEIAVKEGAAGDDKSHAESEIDPVGLSDVGKSVLEAGLPSESKSEDETELLVATSESESVDECVKQNDLENSNVDLETVKDVATEELVNKEDAPSLLENSSNNSTDTATIKMIDLECLHTTHKSSTELDVHQPEESSIPPDANEISEVKKGDSAFDLLLNGEINKTAESECTKTRKLTFPEPSNGECDAKENDVSMGDVEGTSTSSIDLDDDCDEIIVSSDKDDSRGFAGIGQKRSSSIDDTIESKRRKVAESHKTDSTKDLDSSDAINQGTRVKRPSQLFETPDSKKSCLGSPKVSTKTTNEHMSKTSEGSTNNEGSSTHAPARKSLSNIDKAIERVAFAGLDRKERIMMPFIKDLKNRRLQDITVDDLEELVTQRMGEVLSDSGENGILREKVQKLERMTEFWKHKATSLQKQLSDMTMVFKKLATETKQNSSQLQIPIKITRSVGLQVIMPSVPSVGKSNTTQGRNGLPPGSKRKSGGIMTNRNTTPNIHYPTSSLMTQNRPVVQKVIPPPISVSTPTKLPQAVPAAKSPVVGPLPPAVRFRAPNVVVTSVITTGTVTTSTGTVRTVPSIPARQILKSMPSRPGNDMLIDLTDEDDKTKRVSSSGPLPTTLRLAQFNGSPPTQGGTIRIVSPQQLSGTATGVNGQRLAYMLPASAANAATGRLQLFTQQTTGNLRTSGLLTVRQPPTQTLTLKNGTVISSATPASAIIRAGAASTGTFQQVVPRQGPMRTIQPASRLTNGQISRTGVLTESQVNRPLVAALPPVQHPAPLPPPPAELPSSLNWKKSPPRPDLKISKVDTRDQHGIILSWNMDHGPEHEEIASYQLYAYQENSGPPLTSLWKKVGDVKAMPLPMACTLTQFLEGNKYHFAVRAVDIHSRCGMFSIPGHIILPRRVSS